MKKDSLPPIPIRWYASDPKAEKRLLACGAVERAIYRGWKGETPGKFKMRAGEFLGVVDGYRAFGHGKREITKAVDAIHADGATILDVETGKDSRNHGHILFDAATAPRRQTEEDRKLLAEERAGKYRKKRGMASKADAHKIWHMIGPSIESKAAATGWSRAALYDAFGKTGAPTGRRPKGFAKGERELPAANVKPARPKGGFVYFMRLGTSGPVKIGYANSIKARFREHKVSNHSAPVLLAAMRGTMKSERQLHERFKSLRLEGRREWFNLRGDLKAFIGMLPKIETDLE